jgi:hypothetical protein
MTGKKGLVSLLVFFLLFLSALSPLFSKGRRDTVFAEADRLIEERNYVEAINELIKIATDDPSIFGNVQRRLESVVRSAAQSAAIDRQSFDNILDYILVNGRLLIDQGDYINAFNLYLGGFSFHQNVLAEPNFPASVLSPMSTTQRIIGSISVSFGLEAQRIQELAAEFDAIPAVSDNPCEQLAAVTQAVDQFRRELNGLIQMKNLLWNMRDAYLSYNTVENSEEGRYYAAFGSLMINGRPEAESDVREGFLGVTDGLWRRVTRPLKRVAMSAANRAFAEVYAALQARDYSLVRRLIAETTTALHGPLELITMSALFDEQDNLANETVFGTRLRSSEVSYYTIIESLNRILPLLSQSVNYAVQCDAANTEMLASTTLADYRAKRISAAQAVRRETGIRASISELEITIHRLTVLFEENFYEIFPIRLNYDGAFRGGEFFRSGMTFNSSLERDLPALRVAAAIRQYTVENEDFGEVYSQRRSQFNAGSAVSEGVLKTLSSGESYLSKNPLEASRLFESLSSSLSSDIERGRNLLNRYDNEVAAVINAREIISLSAEAAGRLVQYETLYTQTVTLSAVTLRAVDEAETLRADGARLYQNALSALEQGRIDAADDYINRSNIRYGASLAIQDSDMVRNESRERSLALSAEIMRVRREFVRDEVVDLVERAQSEFFINNHRLAEELLVQAETLHATISDEENPSIRYWLAIVRNALSFRSVRTISFTAPLYPEMSQLLSSAEMDYAKGMTLLNTHREEALSRFSNVRQKTQEVKLLFPLNQAANLLELRVDQVVDPAAFTASFEERLNAAVAGTKVSDVQAFADLQDLALINPNYQGIAQIVYQAEIDMGLRPPPPDEVAIAHSRSLTLAAQNLIAGGARSNLEVAQEQLTEALRIYPDNTTAQAELDRVQRLMGQRAASEIEAAADNDYEEALRELLAGNKLVAYSIVRRILSRPEYQNSSRFRELLQRIESVL